MDDSLIKKKDSKARNFVFSAVRCSPLNTVIIHLAQKWHKQCTLARQRLLQRKPRLTTEIFKITKLKSFSRGSVSHSRGDNVPTSEGSSTVCHRHLPTAYLGPGQGLAASVGRSRHSSPQLLPPAAPGESQGVPRTSERYYLISLSNVSGMGSPPGWIIFQFCFFEVSKNF